MKKLKIRIFKNRSYRLVTFLVLQFVLLQSISAQEYQKVKAEKGDGVYSLLRKSGLTPEKYAKDFIELNKTKLGKNNALFIGKEYLLPIVKTDTGTQASSDSSDSTKAITTDSLKENTAQQVTTTSSNSTPNNSVVSSTKIAENKNEVPKVTAAASTSASVGKTTNYNIFGEKYKNVTQKDSELSGAVYYLISGHGGPDPGAIGRYGTNSLCEDEYAYDVTLRLGKALIEHGATVYIIVRDNNDGIRDASILKPDTDEKCYPNQSIPRNQVSRLKQRTDEINKLYTENKGKFQRLVEIHVDSRSKGENIDVFFYYYIESSTGKKVATALQQTFKEKYALHQPGRGYQGSVSYRNLYTLKNSYPPAVFIELGNINHTRDQQRFMLSDNRQALANWLSDGLIKDFKNNK